MTHRMDASDSFIIFTNTDSFPAAHSKSYLKPSLWSSITTYFWVSPAEIGRRILTSLVPPIIGKSYIYVDLLGPCLALVTMAGLLHYGHVSKLPSAAVSTSPSQIMLLYAAIMPALAYVLSRLGGSNIAFSEMVALLGYALYGHILTLVMSVLFYEEKSNAFFFCCLIIFGGLSALRVALVLLSSIPLPAARLLVCSLVATLQILSLVYVHFAYMHRTFVYGSGDATKSPR